MFVHAKKRVARLTALDEELADLLAEARYQGRTRDCLEIIERKRQVRRALLLAGEFETGEAPGPPLTIDEVFERFS
jgi:hypothetical protein